MVEGLIRKRLYRTLEVKPMNELERIERENMHQGRVDPRITYLIKRVRSAESALVVSNASTDREKGRTVTQAHFNEYRG